MFQAHIGVAHGNPFNPYDEWGEDYRTHDLHKANGETAEAALKTLVDTLPAFLEEITAECEKWERETRADWKESLTPEEFASDPSYHSPQSFSRLFLRALEAMDFTAFKGDSISCKQVTCKEEGYQEEVVIMVTDGEDPYDLRTLPLEPEELLPLIQGLAA